MPSWGSASPAAVPGWLAQLPRRPASAAVVPTAGNRLAATPWVDTTVRQLEACGMTVEMLDLEPATPAHILAAISTTDLVWATGGHPIFLLQHARASASSTPPEPGSWTASSTTPGSQPGPPTAPERR